jgi:hypothetical protein
MEQPTLTNNQAIFLAICMLLLGVLFLVYWTTKDQLTWLHSSGGKMVLVNPKGEIVYVDE